MGADYHFVTRWHIQGTREEIVDVLSDPMRLPVWWPSVYLKVTTVDAGGSDGVGRVVDLYTKGWLPYTLRWRFRTTERRGLDGFSLEASGDFVGRGVWSFVEDGDGVAVTYDWRIRADKPLLRRLTWAMRPAFAANHRWAMEQGRKSLILELARRRTTDPVVRAAIPPPPPATFARLHRR